MTKTDPTTARADAVAAVAVQVAAWDDAVRSGRVPTNVYAAAMQAMRRQHRSVYDDAAAVARRSA